MANDMSANDDQVMMGLYDMDCSSYPPDQNQGHILVPQGIHDVNLDLYPPQEEPRSNPKPDKVCASANSCYGFDDPPAVLRRMLKSARQIVDESLSDFAERAQYMMVQRNPNAEET